MTAYFSVMRPVVEAHGGVVAKFIGDAVMAVFGIPTTHEDDALRAVRAAQDMRGALSSFNRGLPARLGAEIATRTGINTGVVAGVGLVPDQNFVAGDTANTAARLQQLASEGEILLGERTFQLVKGAVQAEALAPIQAKGKAEPIRAWRLLGGAGRSGGPHPTPGRPPGGTRRRALHPAGRLRGRLVLRVPPPGDGGGRGRGGQVPAHRRAHLARFPPGPSP